MKKYIFAIGLLIIVLLNLGCKKAPTQPPVNERTTLEYNWEVDTLFNPHGYGVVPWSMWGSSPTDVWTVGFNLAGQGEMFHYDGVRWKRVTPDLGFNYELLAIYGFGANEVYAVGSEIIIDTTLHTKSLIIKYNGASWQTESIIKGSGLTFLHGYDVNNFWACGIEGALYKKNGSIWQKMPFNEKYDLGPIWIAPSGIAYMMYDYDDYQITKDTTMLYFSKLGNNIWETLDSCRLVSVDGIRTGYKFGEKGIIGVSSNAIYSAGSGLFKFNGNIWQVEAWDDYDYKDLKCNNEGVFFAVGGHGTIRYLLNNQWQRIGDYNRYTVDFYSVMPFNEEVFIGAFSAGNGYIVHGTLKK